LQERVGMQDDATDEKAFLNELSNQVIRGALRVHTALGSGLLESAYERCLDFELADMGLSVERQVGVPLVYRGRRIECAYRIDLVVEKSLIVEVKAVEKLHPIHSAQLLSQLRLSGLKLGLIINFHERSLKNGIIRVVNGFPE
jgi:GxxExxY protein